MPGSWDATVIQQWSFTHDWREKAIVASRVFAPGDEEGALRCYDAFASAGRYRRMGPVAFRVRGGVAGKHIQRSSIANKSAFYRNLLSALPVAPPTNIAGIIFSIRRMCGAIDAALDESGTENP